jgi:hypothetical protein
MTDVYDFGGGKYAKKTVPVNAGGDPVWETLAVELLASAARTSSSNSVFSTQRLSSFKRALILLNLTAAATESNDTLDVYLQKNVGSDASPIWTDFVHFTQALGNGGAKQFVAELTNEDITSGLHVVQDAALAAGVNGANASFTFSVHGRFFQ